MVHQAAKMDEEEKEKFLNWLWDLEFNLYGIPEPDQVIFLDVDPMVSQQLMKNRLNKITGEEEKDIHESNEEYLVNSYNNSPQYKLLTNLSVIYKKLAYKKKLIN